MKISYLAQSIIPSRTANSVHVMRMCSAFSSHGHDVTLLVPEHEKAEPGVDDAFAFYGTRPDFEICKLFHPKMRGQTTLSLAHAVWLIRKSSPDLLYTRSWTLCRRIYRFIRTPVVLELHAPVDASQQRAFDAFIDSPVFLRLVVITRALHDYMLDRHPSLRGRIRISHDAADVPPSDIEPVMLHRGRRMVAGYCGQLFKGKGMEVIVDLAKRMTDIDFHVVGGEERDISLWKGRAGNLENLFFHGFRPPADTQKFIAGFDVALAPYQQKVEAHGGGDIAPWMSPLKIFEYMALGKPIVSSNLKVLTEVLADDTNALLCPPTDMEKWAAALRRLESPAERRRLGARAFEGFSAHYTWAVRADNVLRGIEHTFV